MGYYTPLEDFVALKEAVTVLPIDIQAVRHKE